MHRIYILKIFLPFRILSVCLKATVTLPSKPPSRHRLRPQTADWCCWCWPSHCCHCWPPPSLIRDSSRGCSVSSSALAGAAAELYSCCYFLGQKPPSGRRWPPASLIVRPLQGSIRSCWCCSSWHCRRPRPFDRRASLEGVDSSYCMRRRHRRLSPICSV